MYEVRLAEYKYSSRHVVIKIRSSFIKRNNNFSPLLPYSSQPNCRLPIAKALLARIVWLCKLCACVRQSILATQSMLYALVSIHFILVQTREHRRAFHQNTIINFVFFPSRTNRTVAAVWNGSVKFVNADFQNWIKKKLHITRFKCKWFPCDAGTDAAPAL